MMKSLIILAVFVLLALAAAMACGEASDTAGTEPTTTAATTAAVPEPTPATVRVQIDNLMLDQFFGITNTGKNRNSLVTVTGPVEGGFTVVAVFNADDDENPALRKQKVEMQMVDGFEVLFKGDFDLTEVIMSARFLGRREQGMLTDIVVYSTRLTAEVASTIDWDNKANIDFTTVWEVIVQRPGFQ